MNWWYVIVGIVGINVGFLFGATFAVAMGWTRPPRPSVVTEATPADTSPGHAMRDLTDAEWELLRSGICPFCHGDRFYEGPGGGLSSNWFCGNEACEAGFNLNPGYLGNFGNQLIRDPKPPAPIVTLPPDYVVPPKR